MKLLALILILGLAVAIVSADSSSDSSDSSGTKEHKSKEHKSKEHHSKEHGDHENEAITNVIMCFVNTIEVFIQASRTFIPEARQCLTLNPGSQLIITKVDRLEVLFQEFIVMWNVLLRCDGYQCQIEQVAPLGIKALTIYQLVLEITNDGSGIWNDAQVRACVGTQVTTVQVAYRNILTCWRA